MTEPQPPDTPPQEPVAEMEAPPKARRPWYKRWKVILAAIVLTPLLIMALYTALALNWSYSEGDRAGTLVKFSRKGWLCKTWEGELMQPTAPGVAPSIWNFSVRNDSVAQLVNGGLGKRVVLTYKEHRGVPGNCFGDTQYYVDAIRVEP